MLFCVTQVHYKNGGKNADAGGKQQKDDPCEYTGLPALNKPQVRDAVVKKIYPTITAINMAHKSVRP